MKRFKEETGAMGTDNAAAFDSSPSFPSTKKKGVVGEDAPVNAVAHGGVAALTGDPPVPRRVQKKIQQNKGTPSTGSVISVLRRMAPNPIVESKVYAIATRTRKGGLRRVPDTRFESEENARRYGDKYHKIGRAHV